MIVVFGASGQTGGEVTRQVAAQGVPTRALVHNGEKARMLSGLNVEIAQADLARPKTLEAALRGAQKVYFVVTGSALQLSQNVYDAARRSGIRHIVRLSGSFMVGLDAPVQLDRWHAQAEQALERSGLAYTHLRPSFFMQNVLFLGTTGTLALPMGEARVNLVDSRDIAAVAVAALTSAGHERQTYAIGVGRGGGARNDAEPAFARRVPLGDQGAAPAGGHSRDRPSRSAGGQGQARSAGGGAKRHDA